MIQRGLDKNEPLRIGKRSLRCLCGSLLARLVAEGVELKCRRCKRQIVVPLEKSEGKIRPNEA